MELLSITHSQKNMHHFMVLSEFFKLCGFYIQEAINENLETPLVERNYDAKIRLVNVVRAKIEAVSNISKKDEHKEKSKEDEKSGLKETWDIADEIRFAVSESADLSVHKKQVDFITLVLKKLSRKIGKESYALNKFAEAFVSNDLAVHNHDLRYFYSRNMIDCEPAYIGFKNVIGELYGMEQIYSENELPKHLWFCKINCMYKLNMLCDNLKRKRYTEPRYLMSQLRELTKKYPNYNLAYVLMGKIAESDVKLSWTAGEYYKFVTEKYDSYTYYRIGHFYEKELKNYQKALAYYEESYKIDESNFRSMFKIGYCMSMLKQTEPVISIYQKACNMILPNEELVYWLEPLQLEYIIKMLSKQVIGFKKMNKLREAKEAAEIGVEICKSLKKNEFFDLFYGKEMAKSRRELMISYYENGWLADELRMLNLQLEPFESQ